MTHRPPTSDEIAAIAGDLGLSLSSDDVASYARLAAPFLGGLALLDALPEEEAPPRYPRGAVTWPDPADNALGAWYVRSRIAGARQGPLAGRTVAVKDNVMVAGVPMANGSAILCGYVPPVDATVVTRILDAGGTILGKAVCESYCLSGGSHTSDSGPVRNPHDPSRMAGGSSSGSAVLVATGEVDLALGGDQGGSIRMPSSWCGTVGMKPTHGLVPYTGILSIEPTIDHVGPITADVADNARFLEVLAGADGLDSRQIAPRVDAYTAALGADVAGLRIGILEEGFAHASSEPEVDAAVRAALDRLAQRGAKVAPISVPEHRLVGPLTGPIFQSAFFQVLQADGCMIGRDDPQVASFLDHHRGWRQRADELPETVKVFAIATELTRRRYGWRYYAKAQRQLRRVRAAFDVAFEEVDLLAMPTTPTTALPLPPAGAPREAILAAAAAPVGNTQTFDHTHHPALSLPCGARRAEGPLGEVKLPIGLMLVGRAFEESTVYRAAHALERALADARPPHDR